VYNQQEFGSRDEAVEFLAPFLTAGLILILIIIGLSTKIQFPEQIKKIFIVAGLYLILSDIIAPVAMGELTGDDEQVRISEPVGNILKEMILFGLLLVFLFFVVKKSAWQFLSTLSYVLILSVLLVSGLNYGDKNSITNNIVATNQTMGATFDGNIYQIYLDAYSGYAFLPAVDKTSNLRAFDDFIYYPNNRSNYDHTTPSSASFRLGFLNDPNMKMSEYTDLSKREGFSKKLFNSGFRVWNYVESSAAANPFSFKIKTNQEVYESSTGFSSKISLLRDFWSLRIIPTIWHKDLYYKGSGVFTRHFSSDKLLPTGENARTYASKLLLEEMIRDEELRGDKGEYVYVHSYLTHGPYIFDEDCNTRENRSGDKYSQDEYYLPQVICANKVVIEFLDLLKRLDRFDKSLIFIHADHGTWEIGPNEYIESKLDSISESFLKDKNLRNQPGRYMDNQTRALLLFKPPRVNNGNQNILQVSAGQSQLLDIAPTIAEYSNIEANDFEGTSLSRLPLMNNRDIKITIGFKQILETGETVSLGNQVNKLKLIEFINEKDKYRLNREYVVDW
jgi:hypothetical protein